MGESDPASLARTYYEAIDAGDYDGLEAVLAPDFVHVRSDRTVDGRDAFVRFMRDERPVADTTHVLDGVYRNGGGGVAVRGRLLRPDGSVWFGFVDAFEVGDRQLIRLTTYSNDRVS